MPDRTTAERYFSQGDKHKSQSKINKAIQFYLQSVNSDPSFIKPYKRLNSIQKLNPKQVEQIIENYQSIIEQYQSPAIPYDLYIMLGNLFTRKKQFDQSAFYYQLACSKITKKYNPEFWKRHWNSEQFGKPDFMIIGIAKAGTTSLFHYLTQHPNILRPVQKEIRFFTRDEIWEQGMSWYSSHFPFIPPDQPYVTGEATPTYLSGNVQEKIYSVLPKIKLIVILRDPVDRVISHYHHRVKHRWESNTLENRVETELEMLKNFSDDSDITQYSRNNKFLYLLDGLYYYHLKEWMNLFPVEQLLILDSDTLKTNPEVVMDKTFKFLQLPDYPKIIFGQKNVGSYPSLNGSIYEKLKHFFEPHNRKLKEELGLDFSWI